MVVYCTMRTSVFEWNMHSKIKIDKFAHHKWQRAKMTEFMKCFMFC